MDTCAIELWAARVAARFGMHWHALTGITTLDYVFYVMHMRRPFFMHPLQTTIEVYGKLTNQVENKQSGEGPHVSHESGVQILLTI